MLNYKILTERKIINNFFHYIKRVNPRKKYSPSSLTKEEYSKVKELLMVRMQMNNEQADFILKKRYVNSSLKESLFNLEKIPVNIEKYNILTQIRNVKHKSIGYLVFFIFFLLLSIIWNLIIFLNSSINVDNLLINNLICLPLGLFGTLNTMINYGFFCLRNYLDDDEIYHISGVPYKINIGKCFVTKSDRSIGVNEILYIILYFKNEGKKQKLIYLVESDLTIWNKNNKKDKIRNIKASLLKKKFEIDFYKKTKYIKSINININKIIKKITR